MGAQQSCCEAPKEHDIELEAKGPAPEIICVESDSSDDPMSPREEASVQSEPNVFKVDMEILRGIPLHHALRRTWIWIRPDLFRQSRRSSKLWAASMSVESLDVFISHSWRTPGRNKILGLLLQSGWIYGLLTSILLVALASVLRYLDILDAPLRRSTFLAGDYQSVSESYWLLLAAPLGLFIGFCFSLRSPWKRSVCFLDIACVHQGREELLQRGIRNIGGCLAVSRELQVLYHPTYFRSSSAVCEAKQSFSKALA